MDDKLLQTLTAFNVEDLKSFLNGIKWESRNSPYGGQHVGRADPGVVLIHEDFGIRIEVFEKRNQIENKQIALKLFYHFLDMTQSKKPSDGTDTTTTSP
jgi:protein subunit release factor A